jgi:hypothetical protein
MKKTLMALTFGAALRAAARRFGHAPRGDLLNTIPD